MFDSGARLIRFLVTVRSDLPRKRVDVIPVVQWDPPDALWEEPAERGSRIWVCGAVQRRFWESDTGRRSRIEVVAEQVILREGDDPDAIIP